MKSPSMLLAWLSAALLVLMAAGNTEKVIFLAPAATSEPTDASIDNLLLLPLNLNHRTVRTYINASFPDDDHPKGLQNWFLLQGLTPGQRYEVRICWLATQPTSFWLYTHTVSETLEDPTLISAVSQYAYARHSLLDQAQVARVQSRKHANGPNEALLFLQVYAAADYFTLNRSMMENVPPVFADIILDPYLFNVVPQSLLPTIGYIVLLAIAAWAMSAWSIAVLQRISNGESSSKPDPKRTGKKIQ